jgi:TolB-like protein
VTKAALGGLSYLSALFVIARNSTFAYKSKACDLRQVDRIGVRYVPDCARERFMVASEIGRRDDPAVRSRVL